MPLFNFTQPQQQSPGQVPPWMQQAQQQGMDQYNQQGQNLIDPGSAQLAQSNPIAGAGRQALGGALQQAGQQGPPGMQPGMPMDLDAHMAAQNQAQIPPWMQQAQQQPNQQQALAQQLMSTPSYPNPNFGRKGGVWT